MSKLTETGIASAPVRKIGGEGGGAEGRRELVVEAGRCLSIADIPQSLPPFLLSSSFPFFPPPTSLSAGSTAPLLASTLSSGCWPWLKTLDVSIDLKALDAFGAGLCSTG